MIDRMGHGFREYAPFILRLGLAALFLVWGARDLEQAGSRGMLVPILELLGGALLLVGFLTRYAAIALAVWMLFGILQHSHGFLAGDESRLEFAVLMMCLAVFCTGGGKLSVDLSRKKKQASET